VLCVITYHCYKNSEVIADKCGMTGGIPEAIGWDTRQSTVDHPTARETCSPHSVPA